MTHWVLAVDAMGKVLILSVSEAVSQRVPQFYLVLIWWESITSFKPEGPWFPELSKCSFIPACKQANLSCLLFWDHLFVALPFKKKKYPVVTNSCYGLVSYLKKQYQQTTKKYPKLITSLQIPQWHTGKDTACNARDVGSVSGSGRSPGEGNGNPL